MKTDTPLVESQAAALRSQDPPQGGRSSAARKARLAWQIVQVRLRLPLVLLAAFLVVGQWHVLRNYWDKLTGAGPQTLAGGAVSSDTEYFCPMDPGVLSDWPGKCSICNMALVRRAKGAAMQLPDGVVARMQLSPYRIQLAGVETSVVGFRPLTRRVETAGNVAAVPASGAQGQGVVQVEARLSEKDLPWVVVGQPAEVICGHGPAREPLEGKVVAVGAAVAPESLRAAVKVEVPGPEQRLPPGMLVTVRLDFPIDQIEPFRSQPVGPPPGMGQDVMKVYTCPDHPAVLQPEPGACPWDEQQLVARRMAPHQRLEWWCPLHAAVTSRSAGATCRECGGLELLPHLAGYRPAGMVLAVPHTAVVDTGERQVIYVESQPGMFDGIEVVLGPRSGEYYPVARGLEPGQRVVTTGAFLVDAETRLNPSLAAGYFGSGRSSSAGGNGDFGPSTPAAADASRADPLAVRRALLELPGEERLAAAKQKRCPVTGLELGSMGRPPQMEISGRVLWLCCEGCRAAVEREPDKYFARLDAGTP